MTDGRLTLVRVGLALAGFAAALLAVAFESRNFGWLAIVLLTGSLVVRVVQRRRRPPV